MPIKMNKRNKFLKFEFRQKKKANRLNILLVFIFFACQRQANQKKKHRQFFMPTK